MAWSGDFRILAAQTTETVETARTRCDLSPLATSALGRALTGAALLARLLDKQVRHQHVTLRFEGNGPLGTVIAEASVDGAVRGYVTNAQAEAPENGSAIGEGLLTVIRRTPPLGKPYTSQVRLQTGEVATDLAHYLSSSEQIASAVLLGVFNRPTGVAAAGGMIIQAFPHTSESAIETMEQRIKEVRSFSSLLANMSIDEAVQEVLHGADYKAIDSSFDIPISYQCTCTRERALRGFTLFSRQELGEMIKSEKASEAVCQFCCQKYTFGPDDLMAMNAAPDA